MLCQPSNTNEITLSYYKTYDVACYKIDLFHLFFEKGIGILKGHGKLSYITPNTYLTNTYIEPLRELLLLNTIYNLTINATGVFADANVDVCTICICKSKFIETTNPTEVKRMDITGVITSNILIDQESWINNTNKIIGIQPRFDISVNNTVALDNIASVTFGLQTKDKATFVKTVKIDGQWEYCYTGRDISRYYLDEPSLYFMNKPEDVKAGGSWDMSIHHAIKIVVRQIGAPEPIFAFDKYGYATLNTMYSVVVNNTDIFSYKYILAILCSSLIKKWWLSRFFDNKDLFPKIKGGQLKEIPIRDISLSEQQPFIDLADQMLSMNADLQTKRQRFIKRLADNLDNIKITGALERFDEMEFKQFLEELKKQKITLSLKQQDEWEEYFTASKTEYQALATQVAATDRQIDQMVYALYNPHPHRNRNH